MEDRGRTIQERFRRANDELQSRYVTLEAVGAVPFICECVDQRCTRVISLTLDEYAAVRTGAGQFLIVPGHDVAGERVLVTGERYAVAGKDDAAAASEP